MLTTLAHGLESDDPADQLWEEASGTSGAMLLIISAGAANLNRVWLPGMGPGTAPLQP